MGEKKNTKRDGAKLLRDSKRNPRPASCRKGTSIKGVAKFRHSLFDDIVGTRKKATRPKRKQWLTTAKKKKRYNRAKKIQRLV